MSTRLPHTSTWYIVFEGTKVDEAKQLIAKSGLRIAASDDLDAAAERSVQIAGIVDQARAAGLDVTVHMSTDDIKDQHKHD